MNIEQMYKEFLERLNNKTAEELMAEIKQAREDSKDSWILDEIENKMKNECFLFRNPCPNRSGACLCANPDGDSCPLYRWFKAKVLEVERDVASVVRCKDCKYAVPALNGFSEEGFKCANEHTPGYESFWWFRPDWFCPDGERKEK